MGQGIGKGKKKGIPGRKRKWGRLAGGRALAAAVVVGAIVMGNDEAPEPEPEPLSVSDTATGAEAPAPASRSAASYVVGEWEGRLAVYSAGRQTPDQVYDVYISTLPEEERKRLEEGIPVSTEKELASLLEDYTS